MRIALCLLIATAPLALAACGGKEGEARARVRQMAASAEFNDIAIYPRPGRPDVACGIVTQPALSEPPPPLRAIVPLAGGNWELEPPKEAVPEAHAAFAERWRIVCRK